MDQWWIDGHLDLAYCAVNGRDLRVPIADSQGACVSLPVLRDADVRIVFATIFTAPPTPGGYGEQEQGPEMYCSSDDLDDAERAGRVQLAVYKQLEREGELEIVRSGCDLDAGGTRLKVVLLMEGADPIRAPDHVGEWFARGLRIVGLTWAVGTRYAGGNHTHGPLTPLGIEMIQALDESGIVHDASHLSDESFDGLLEHATGRIVATHSNARALLDDKQRHLRDDQILAIAEREGIIGLNLYGAFLAPPGESRRATIKDCVRNVEHVVSIMGHRGGVALGSDMDGGFPPRELPEKLDHPAKLNALANALSANGWSDEEVRGFAHGNWLRFLRKALGSGQ